MNRIPALNTDIGIPPLPSSLISQHPTQGRSSRFRLMQAILLSLPLLAASPLAAATVNDITELSLEQLLNVSIIGASKYEQKQGEVAAAVSVITRSQIKTFGWRTLNDALASLPGIHTTYDRQYSYVGTRGFGLPGDYNTRVLVTVDGNRWNDVVYDGAALGRALPLDMDLVERIEFIPGPGGAVYGQNALFGVVNVITRNGAGMDGAETAVSYQNPGAAREGRATWGKVLDNGVDVLVSASAYKADGEDRFFDYPGGGPAGTDASGVASNMDGEKDKTLFTRLGRGPWSFDLAYGDRRKDDPTASYFGDPLVSGQYQRDRSLLTQLQYQDSFGDGTLQLSGRLFLGRTRYTGLFFYDGVPNLATGSGDWQGFEARLLSTAWAGHKLMLGMEFQDSSRQDQGNEDLIDPANNIEIARSGWRAGVFVQNEWTLGDSVTATLGLRFDRNNVTGNDLSPRAALIWQATPDTTLKALYGRAHRAPNVYERDFDDGVSQIANPDLEGETIDTLELVIDQRVGRNLNVRASVYQWSMQGLVTLTEPVTGLSQYQTGEDVKARGVELSADTTWDWGGRLRGSLSYQDLAYKSGAGLDNAPQLLGKLNFSGPLASTGLRFGYELHYSSERQAIDGTDLDGYWLSNLNLSTDKWAKGLEVSLGIYNLFDTRYDHPGSDTNWQTALEQDGRSARLKMAYRF